MRITPVAGLIAAVLIAAALVMVLAVVGIGRGATSPGGESTAAGGTAVTPVEPDAAIVVRARLRADNGLAPASVLDDLPTAAVLHLRVTGFEPFQRGVARQCHGDAESRRCGNGLPVQFDGHGIASFQYLVRAHVGERDAGGCGLTDPPCLVTVTSIDGRRRAELLTVFGGRLPPPGTAVVEPRRGLRDGERVTVELTGLPPGRLVTVTTCVAGSTPDRSRCGAPAPSTEVMLDADGAGRTQLAVTRGPVGALSLTCEQSLCVIAVLEDRIGVRVDPVQVTFRALPGADYDPTRLGVGLGVAALLAAIASWLVRRTDWSPVGEGAAPEIDNAHYADLDAIIAVMPDEDASTRPDT